MVGAAGDYVTVHARRSLDGVTFTVEGLDRVHRLDVQALHMDQLLAPGELIEWEVTEHPRPWQHHGAAH